MRVGFIGGSGIYEALPLTDTREQSVETPFGEPSAPITIGQLEGTDREVAFIPRHGRNHEYSPTTSPYRANVFALKTLGVECILSSNAVGSLQEEFPPRTLVIPDQAIDRTRHRPFTFFDEGLVVHMPFASPYSPELSAHLAESARTVLDEDGPDHDEVGIDHDGDVVEGGTYVCIEGPQYSTKAESEWFRDQGWEIIGMTTIPEAKLAREAELPYATITGVTDWGVWKGENENRLQEVLENADRNQDAIKATVEHAVRTLPEDAEYAAENALEGTINTPSAAIPGEVKTKLEPLLGKYV